MNAEDQWLARLREGHLKGTYSSAPLLRFADDYRVNLDGSAAKEIPLQTHFEDGV